MSRTRGASSGGRVLAHDGLALLSGAAVGCVLALIGGGGSILATPLLLYVVGVSDPHLAIGTSALAVSANAFANLVPHARRGNVRWPCALVFAATGIAGAALGAHLGKLTDPHVLTPLFALAMIAMGVAMLLRRDAQGADDIVLTRAMIARLSAAGVGVGAVSGFFGIGGGFLIVPGLIVATGMSMVSAIGSSLAAVAAFGATTAVSYALDSLVDWRLAGLFIVGGIVGGIAGAALCTRLSTRRGTLQKVFAGVVFVVAAYMLWRSLAGA